MEMKPRYAKSSKLLTVGENDAGVYINRGISKAKLGDREEGLEGAKAYHDKAIADYTKAIELDPSNENYKKAKRDAEEALKRQRRFNSPIL